MQVNQMKLRDEGEAYRFVEGPLLKQIITHKEAIIPTATKIRVPTMKPIFEKLCDACRSNWAARTKTMVSSSSCEYADLYLYAEFQML